MSAAHERARRVDDAPRGSVLESVALNAAWPIAVADAFSAPEDTP